MNRWMRFLAALGICLSGWALIPFASFPRQAFGWELYAGAYTLIFQDGFESGSTANWDRVVGEVLQLPTTETDSYDFFFRLDAQFWRGRKAGEMVVLEGLTTEGGVAFSLAVRPAPGGVDARLTASRDGSKVKSAWRRVPADATSLRLEWRRAFPGGDDGYLYLSVEDRLRAWLVDLENSGTSIGSIAIHSVDGSTPLVDLTGLYGTRPGVVLGGRSD